MEFKLAPGCFYGELSKSCEASGLRLTGIVHSPRQRTHEHSHERAYFSLTLAGTHTKLYGTRSVRCTPQTLVFHPPGQRQSSRSGESGARSFMIEIEPRVLARLSGARLDPERLAVFRGGSLAWLAARLYGEFRRADELSELAIEGL